MLEFVIILFIEDWQFIVTRSSQLRRYSDVQRLLIFDSGLVYQPDRTKKIYSQLEMQQK